MRKLSSCLLLLMLLASGNWAAAQIDTTGGRYYQPIFPNVTIEREVKFGEGRAQGPVRIGVDLEMDVYQPEGDTRSQRPVIILAHEGGFAIGERDDFTMTELCTRFARLGYVTASIDYRLITPTELLDLDTVELSQAGLLAQQDMRAAVRYFRQDAATTNRYRVEPRYIFVGGSSAGAITALETAYLNRDAEVPAIYNLADLGGLEGSSGNPGYSSQVRAVINLSGAVTDLAWLEPGEVPLVSVHGTADRAIPFNKGRSGVEELPEQYVFGSGAIKGRADALGIPNALYALKGAGHVPYGSDNPTGRAYMDTTFRFVRDFLRPILAQPGTVTSNQPAVARTQVVQLYPVPATTAVRLVASTATAFRPREMELWDASGRMVRRFRWEQAEYELPRETLRAGVYWLRGEGMAGQRIVFE